MVDCSAEGVVAQDLDDPTVGNAPAPALLDHPFKLATQRLKALDPLFDIAELRFRDGIRGLAGLFGLVAEAQQIAYGLQGEPQCPGVPNECKPAYVFVPKEPLVAFGTRRARQEADLLVVADRLYFAAGRLCGATDSHSRRHVHFP